MTDFIFLIVGVVLGAVGWWFYTTLFNKYRELKTEIWLKKKELESLNERISKKMRELDDVKEFWDWKLGVKR
jgi:uncharacterized membrane-anchored protein YhcB (DUF1043 family)